MVGISKWEDEWKVFVHDSKDACKKPIQIAADLTTRYPRAGKVFTAGGVKYVLGQPKPILANDQVLAGGIQKNYHGSQSSYAAAGKSGAIHNAIAGSSAIPVGSSYNLESQTYPSIRTITGGPQSFNFHLGQTSTYPSTTSSSPSNLSSHPPSGMNSSHSLPRSYPHPEQSFGSREQPQYPTPANHGGNANSPLYNNGDGSGVRHNGMRRTPSRQINLAGYGQEQFNPHMMGNDGRGQHVQPGGFQANSAQMQPAMDQDMNQFMNTQTHQVMAGFNHQNGGQLGLGRGVPFNSTRGIMQSVSSQFPAPNGFQVPQQNQQMSHGISSAPSPSVKQAYGDSMGRVPDLNHGLQNFPGNASSGHVRTQTDRPSQQGTFGEGDSHIKLGHNKQTSTPNVATSSHKIDLTTKPSEARNTQNPPYSQAAPSSTKPSRVGDAFDFEESGDAVLDPQLLDLLAEPHTNTASVSRSVSYSKVEAPASQAGSKRKHQEDEPVRHQLSGATVYASNVDHQISPNKRQKRDESKQVEMPSAGTQGNGAAVTGQSSMQGAAPIGGNSHNPSQKENMQPSQDTTQRPASSIRPPSQIQASQSDPSVSRVPEIINVFDFSLAIIPDYDAKLLQEYRNGHEGRTPEQEMDILMAYLRTFGGNNKGVSLNSEQENMAKQRGGKIRQEAKTLLRSPSTTPQNSKQVQENDQKSGGGANGLPQSAIPLSEQRMQHKIMQEKIAQSNKVGDAVLKQSGTSKQPSYQQQATSNSTGKHNNPTQPLQHQASLNQGTTGAPPAYHTTPRMNGAASQNYQAGAQLKAPPTSQPTPRMSQSTTTNPPQTRVTGNGVGGAPHPQAPTNANRPMSAPQQAQYKGNGDNNMQPHTGYLPDLNMARPNTAPLSASHETLGSLHLLEKFNNQQTSAPMQNSTVRPSSTPNAGPSMGGMLVQMQPPPLQQACNIQQFPVAMPVSTPSAGQCSYQSPYQQNGHIDPQSAQYQPPRHPNQPLQQNIHTQPMHQAANGSGAGKPSTAFKQKVKKPTSASTSSNSRKNTSSSETVSPNTTDSTEPTFAGEVTMLHLESPVFHEHFTFPTTRDGWNTMLDHANSDYTVVKTGTVIIMRSPVFMGEVTWPSDTATPPPAATIPPPTTSRLSRPIPPSVKSRQPYVAPVPAVAAAPLPAPATAPLPTTSGLTLPMPPGYSYQGAPVAAFVPAPAKTHAPQPARQVSSIPSFRPSTSTTDTSKSSVLKPVASTEVGQQNSTSDTNSSQPSVLKPVASAKVDQQKSTSNISDSQAGAPKPVVSENGDQQKSISETNNAKPSLPKSVASPKVDQQQSTTNTNDPQTSAPKPVTSPKSDQHKASSPVASQKTSQKTPYLGDPSLSFEERMDQITAAALARVDNDDDGEENLDCLFEDGDPLDDLFNDRPGSSAFDFSGFV